MPDNMRACILLLTKNAGPRLNVLLESVKAQRGLSKFEILAVDSGSDDGTIAVLKRHLVRLIQISPSAFSHGETRNLAAHTAGDECEYIVYLSQDAVPADDHWLENLLRPMQQDPQVAGVFSRHVPQSGASPSLVRQLTIHWQTGGTERLVKQMPGDPAEYQANKSYYTYFSNTSSALRRSVWQRIPFHDLAFAEDADWADRVLKAGYKIVFEPSSIVRHSHDYSIIEQFRQNVDHSEAMVALFAPPELRNPWLLLRQIRSLPREIWRDLKFMRQSELYVDRSVWQQIRWVVRSPFWYLASFIGGWVGVHLHVLPASWRPLFSRQERMKRGIDGP